MSGWRSLLGGYGGGMAMGSPAGGGDMGAPSSGAASNPGTGPGGINAGQLQPNTRAANMAAGVPYQFIPTYPPFARVAADANIVYFPRFRHLVFGGAGIVAATTTQVYTFSVPTLVIARTGAARMPNGTALDVGKTALDTFSVQFFRSGSSNDILDAGSGNVGPQVQVLGSAVLGTGGLPGFICPLGMFLDVGGFLNVTVQTLVDNVTVWVSIWCIEEYGPARG